VTSEYKAPSEENRLVVRDGSRPVSNRNELEWIEGEIWGNIWTQEIIARIDPRSGLVNSSVDFKDLRAKVGCTDVCEVLNGIAYGAPRKPIFVTGKLAQAYPDSDHRTLGSVRTEPQSCFDNCLRNQRLKECEGWLSAMPVSCRVEQTVAESIKPSSKEEVRRSHVAARKIQQ
jgi:hypothetical protein